MERKNGEIDYTEIELQQVRDLSEIITDDERENLIQTIIVKTQNFVNENFKENLQQPVELFKALLSKYDGIDKQQLRENLRYFLERVIPAAQEAGVNRCS